MAIECKVSVDGGSSKPEFTFEAKESYTYKKLKEKVITLAAKDEAVKSCYAELQLKKKFTNLDLKKKDEPVKIKHVLKIGEDKLTILKIRIVGEKPRKGSVKTLDLFRQELKKLGTVKDISQQFKNEYPNDEINRFFIQVGFKEKPTV